MQIQRLPWGKTTSRTLLARLIDPFWPFARLIPERAMIGVEPSRLKVSKEQVSLRAFCYRQGRALNDWGLRVQTITDDPPPMSMQIVQKLEKGYAGNGVLEKALQGLTVSGLDRLNRCGRRTLLHQAHSDSAI
jgi:hypothetical protein